ncbi:MAG: ATP-binding protein [bacterium]
MRNDFAILYGKRWWAAAALFLSYAAALLFLDPTTSGPGALSPVSGIAISILFFEGGALWPIIYIAAFAAGVLQGWPALTLLFLPAAFALEALLAAALLQKAEIDPLFRSKRDVLWLFATIALVSCIVPSVEGLLALPAFTHHGYWIVSPLASWALSYAGTACSLALITPFVLRWLAKPRFSRPWREMIETVAALLLLVGISAAAFLFGFDTAGGVPLAYFLLIPLSWLALRMRPRFVSLALLFVAVFALSGTFAGTSGTTLLTTELFLTALSGVFLVIAALEEERRLHSNLTRSQVATLENVVARVSSESRAKNDFIAVLAHELRNPLAPIQSGIDLLKLTSKGSDEQETLSMMDGRMATIRRLLDDLLDVSRISEGKMSVKKERVDLGAIIRRATLSTAHYFDERHQTLTIALPAERLSIEGDPVRLEQIFSNLFTNASKYSRSGGTISITLSLLNNEAEIRVVDDGIGIEKHELEAIFTPFHQANQGVRSRMGLGIGLALVRSLAEMHGGSVAARSDGRGKGSTFVVRLPLDQALASEAPQKDAPSKRDIRVLVVDDNDAAAWGIGKVLEMRGAAVDYAYDGKQALEKVASLPPRAILLDIGLPGEDGYAIGKKLRSGGFVGKLIALIGYGESEDRRRGREAGFNEYLVKPAGLEDLKRVIPELG